MMKPHADAARSPRHTGRTTGTETVIDSLGRGQRGRERCPLPGSGSRSFLLVQVMALGACSSGPHPSPEPTGASTNAPVVVQAGAESPSTILAFAPPSLS